MRFIAGIILFACILSSTARDLSVRPDYQKKFSHLNTKDGLSDNRVLDVFQDRYGFIWIATLNGLNRFDGYEFLSFLHSNENEFTISSDIITCIDEDIYGNLWIGTVFGLNKYDRKNNGFYHIFEEDGLTNNHIREILADEKGILWVETIDGYLHKINIRNERIETYRHQSTSQHYYYYHSILKQNDTTIWVGGRNQDVQRFNPETQKFKTYKSSGSFDNGKRVNDVSHYFIDSKNQMWVCGLDGAYLFDPNSGEFELFLKGSTFDMFEYDKNQLWFGTGNGIYIYSRAENELKHISSDVNNPHSLSNRNVNKIMRDRSGVIWVATNNGINLYSPQQHQFVHYYHIPENESSLSGRVVTAFEEDGSYLWVGTKEEGLNQINLETGKVKKFNRSTSPSLVSNRISDLFLDSKENLWVAQWSGRGFNYLNPERTQAPFFRIDKKTTNVDWYYQIIEGKKDQMLLGVWGGFGLYSVEENHLVNLGKDLKVVPNEKSIELLNCENDSIWWLGGENGCIRFYIPAQAEFYSAKDLFSDKKPGFRDMQKMEENHYFNASIPHFNSVKEIYFKNDTSWFVTEKPSVFYAHQSKEFGYYPHKNHQQKNSKVPIILNKYIDSVAYQSESYFITKEHLYVSSANFQSINKIELECRPVIDLSNVEFHCIEKAKDLLLLGTNKGLILYNRINKKAKFYRTKHKQFMNYPVHLLTSISEGNHQDYWLGTTSTGIARWFPEEGSIVNYVSNEFDSTAFWGWDVSFVYKDSQNRIWSGGNGLHLYDEATDGFIHFTIEDGLPSNAIYGMTEDFDGRLWFTTDKGLSCFYFKEETFINYDEAVGLPDQKMTDAIITLKDERIAAGLHNGFVVFHPDSLLNNHHIPPVVLTRFQVINGKTYDDLNTIDTILLKPDEKHIAFSFASLDFNSSEDNKYAYKIEGVDEDWLLTDSKSRWINYSNLNPGWYVLKLRGSNNNDIWNNNGKILHIYIMPHYYEQWWFYLFIGLVVVFVIVMIVIYRIRELNLQTRSAKIEQRFLRSQMNPHFIFNSLGAIQNYIFKNEPLEAATYLSDFSSLVRKILNNSRNDFVNLEEEIDTLKQYLELQKLRFDDKFDYKLIVDEQLKDNDFEIPPMLGQPFIENSIEHAFKGMDEKGLIKICFKKEGDIIRLYCRDNGIGIKKAIKHKKEEDKKHQSLATKITQDRIRVLNKVYRSNIKISIQDLNDLVSSERGTQVIIDIPGNLKSK